MGRLTEDMRRLAAEINTGRSERGQLMHDIRQATADMRRAVGQMKMRFHAAHAQMAHDQQKKLREFVSHLHSTVTGLRSELASDLAGARAAFFGAAAASAGRRHSRRAATSFSGETA